MVLSVSALIEQLEHLAKAGKVARLKPETARLVARALRERAMKLPATLDVIRAFKGCDCNRACYECQGKANIISRLYHGDDDPFSEQFMERLRGMETPKRR